MNTLVSVKPPKENTNIFVHFPNNQSTPKIGVAQKQKISKRPFLKNCQIKHAIGGDNFGWTKWMAISTSRCQDKLLKLTKNYL
jgi:hypothetical protein